MMEKFKEAFRQAMKEKGCTGKRLAEATDRDDTTVSRYLSGETKDVPLDFAVKGAKFLNLSLDELAGIPTAKGTRDELYEHIRELYEGQIKNKDEHIAALKRRVEKLEAEHKEDHKDMRARMDRKNKIIMRLFIALTVISMAALYFVVDAYHGDWGLVRYEALLELLPEAFGGASYDVQAAEDFVGLWLK